jgi:hypothetical protein
MRPVFEYPKRGVRAPPASSLRASTIANPNGAVTGEATAGATTLVSAEMCCRETFANGTTTE